MGELGSRFKLQPFYSQLVSIIFFYINKDTAINN